VALGFLCTNTHLDTSTHLVRNTLALDGWRLFPKEKILDSVYFGGFSAKDECGEIPKVRIKELFIGLQSDL